MTTIRFPNLGNNLLQNWNKKDKKMMVKRVNFKNQQNQAERRVILERHN